MPWATESINARNNAFGSFAVIAIILTEFPFHHALFLPYAKQVQSAEPNYAGKSGDPIG